MAYGSLLSTSRPFTRSSADLRYRTSVNSGALRTRTTMLFFFAVERELKPRT
jgi:hypothetical protein